MNNRETETSNLLMAEPIKLPCGAVIKNRLIKSAMSDSLGDGKGNPTHAQARLYERWALGGIGLSIIGEVQTDPRYPERPGNLILNQDSDMAALKAFTSRAVSNGMHLWPQLGHAGGLSYYPIGMPKGPSSISVDDFQCENMTPEDIARLPSNFALAATIAKATGFTGVQIHAAHGFLLSQFLSPLFNKRSDAYGGSIKNRCRIIVEVINAVRGAVGCDFPVGIKINSSDQLEGGLTQQDALAAIRLLDKTSVDLIEISGGSYFPGAPSSSEGTSGGPYFTEFAAQARTVTNKPLVVTGGFKKYDQASKALQSGVADFIGLGRALILKPDLPNQWLTGKKTNPSFPKFNSTPPGGITAWFSMRLTAIGEDAEGDWHMDIDSAIQEYEKRDQLRVGSWLSRLSTDA